MPEALAIPGNSKLKSMNRILLIVLLILTLASCHSTRHIQTAVVNTDSVKTITVVEPPKEDTAAIIRENFGKLQAQHISFTTFSGEMDIDYQDGEGKKINVNANLRMYKDSVIWIRISGIFNMEGLRMYITKDSVKILNKQDKVYTERSVAFLQELTDLPLSLTSLQDLLVGNPVFIDSSISSFSRGNNTISLFCVSQFFKNLLTLDGDTHQMQSAKLDDTDDQRNRTCFLGYDDYKSNAGVTFPTKRTIRVSEKKQLDIKLEYKKFNFNEELNFPFSVPKNYKHN